MAAIAVVVAVLAALTLLPATLAIAGPHINSLRVRHPPTDRAGARRPVGQMGQRDRALSVVAGLAALADPDPADDPAAVAEPRPAGHRRAVRLDDRAQSLRPARQELRPRHQRPAARRRLARLARQGAAATPSSASGSSCQGLLEQRDAGARLERRRRGRRLRQARERRRRPVRRSPPLPATRACGRPTPGDAAEGRLDDGRRRRRHADPDRQGRHDGVLQRDLRRRAPPKKRPPTSSKSSARA